MLGFKLRADYNSGDGRRPSRALPSGDFGNARPGGSVEEVTGPPEQRKKKVSSGLSTRQKNPTAGLQSGNDGGPVFEETSACAGIRPPTRSTKCSWDTPAGRPPGLWLLATLLRLPIRIYADSGSNRGLRVNPLWRASRQLQWRDRTGFTPDFLFSSPRPRSRGSERATCGSR